MWMFYNTAVQYGPRERRTSRKTKDLILSIQKNIFGNKYRYYIFKSCAIPLVFDLISVASAPASAIALFSSTPAEF